MKMPPMPCHATSCRDAGTLPSGVLSFSTIAGSAARVNAPFNSHSSSRDATLLPFTPIVCPLTRNVTRAHLQVALCTCKAVVFATANQLQRRAFCTRSNASCPFGLFLDPRNEHTRVYAQVCEEKALEFDV